MEEENFEHLAPILKDMITSYDGQCAFKKIFNVSNIYCKIICPLAVGNYCLFTALHNKENYTKFIKIIKKISAQNPETIKQNPEMYAITEGLSDDNVKMAIQRCISLNQLIKENTFNFTPEPVITIPENRFAQIEMIDDDDEQK